jgi:hypothetical protein
LPVPLSPQISTVAVVLATLATISRINLMRALLPMICLCAIVNLHTGIKILGRTPRPANAALSRHRERPLATLSVDATS